MTDSYSKTETDLKLQAVDKDTRLMFHQVLAEFDKRDNKIEKAFLVQAEQNDKNFKVIDRDLQWLKWLTISFIAGSFILRLFGK